MASHPTRQSEQPVLNVAPINSMPWVDRSNSFQPQGDIETVATAKPALLYLPNQPTEEEWSCILSVAKSGVGLSGSAAIGTIGPVIGKIDIGESHDSYLFRVSLPGVARDDFSCDVDPSGHIVIKGVTTTGEKIIYKNSLKFEMLSQNLCPPGHFSISFRLPGPVDSQHLSGHFGIDGVFEGIVKKKPPI